MIRKILLATAFLFLTVSAPSSSLAKDEIMQSWEVSAAMHFLSVLGRRDFDAAGAFLEEHAVLELPFAGDGITVRGRQGIVAFFRKTMAASIEYKLERAYPSPEAGAVVLEIDTQGRMDTGQVYTNRLVGVFEFRDGKIVLFREYFNPAPVS